VLEQPAANLRKGRLPTVVSGARKSFPLMSTWRFSRRCARAST
jgi:hypothetical protein